MTLTTRGVENNPLLRPGDDALTVEAKNIHYAGAPGWPVWRMFLQKIADLTARVAELEKKNEPKEEI